MQPKILRTALSATSILALATLVLSACAPLSTHLPTGTALTNQQPDDLASANGKLDVTLTAAETMVPFGSSSRWAMTYNGSTVGPTLRVHPGDQLTITLVNDLAEETSLHTHGLHVSPTQDDPFIMIGPGDSYTYTYDIPANHASGTFWYHPHIHGITAEQVASGLSGAILVEDMDDDSLGQTTNRVLVINDPPITDTNPWNSEGGGMNGMGGMGGMNSDSSSGVNMMTAMMGRTGPRLLTNGFEGITLTGAAGKLERLHLVNATASSRLTFSYSGATMVLLSSEGGRLAAPVEITTLTLASSERAEVIVIPNSDGGLLTAQRLSNEASGEALGVPEAIATIGADAGTDLSVLPSTFMMANTRDLFAAAESVARSRVVTLSGHMTPTIDGKLFDPNVIDFTAKRGTVEEWTIRNTSPMYHPIHLHTWGFQVKGEMGWQDVVVVPPNSEQVIRIAFDDFVGTTVVHCHILDHEDTGMMAIIRVE